MHITLQPEVPRLTMGGTLSLTAHIDSPRPQDWVLLPLVNGRRWGHHEVPRPDGHAHFHIPLPNPGTTVIEMAALPRDRSAWMGLSDPQPLLSGTRLISPSFLSSRLEVEVTWRDFQPSDHHETLFCMQWEPWFYHGIDSWRTAHAVPLIGFYDSHQPEVTRQHVLWMMDLGVDFILPDWTNNLWGLSQWDERHEWVNQLVHSTGLFLETLAVMRSEGLPVPRVACFPGLSNGRPAKMKALNEELSWIYHTWVRNPRFAGLWQEWEDKPLMVILDTGAVGDKRGTAESAFRIPFFKHTLELSAGELDAFRAAQPPVDDRHFTIRWMSSQNQTTRHHELGYWSWMDGVPDPPVTFKDSRAESITVTPAYFHALGWTAPTAGGRRNGLTYLETFSSALHARPQVIFLHQFNEFTGQSEGHGMGPNHDIYADSYSVEFSDDLEPVSLTAPGYRGDQGGWGFYYLNLTKALMHLYNQPQSGSLLAAAPPDPVALAEGRLYLRWKLVGLPVDHFNLLLDSQPLQEKLTGESADLPLPELSSGPHTLSLQAAGAQTYWLLSADRLDEPLAQPIPLQINIPFIIP